MKRKMTLLARQVKCGDLDDNGSVDSSQRAKCNGTNGTLIEGMTLGPKNSLRRCMILCIRVRRNLQSLYKVRLVMFYSTIRKLNVVNTTIREIIPLEFELPKGFL